MSWRDGILALLRIRIRKPLSDEEEARRLREEARRLREAKTRLHLLDIKADIIARRHGKTHP